jgi:hypothetical protein
MVADRNSWARRLPAGYTPEGRFPAGTQLSILPLGYGSKNDWR